MNLHKMRPLAIIAATIAISLAEISGAKAMTALDLLNACQVLDRGVEVAGPEVRLPNDARAYMCWGYMQAAQNFAVLLLEGTSRPLLGACVTPEATLLQLIRVFTHYARSHRAKLKLQAGEVVMGAFQDSFPCRH